MVVLSILSILLCVYEYFEFHGLNIRDRKIIQWIDLYISTLFLVNLCNKYFLIFIIIKIDVTIVISKNIHTYGSIYY